MATILLSDLLGEQGQLTTFIDPNHLVVSPFVANASNLLLVDVNSAHDFAGILLSANPSSNPFSYAGGVPIGGHITNIAFNDSSSNPLITVDGLDVDLAGVKTALSNHNLLDILRAVNGGNDSVVGSGVGDDLTIIPGAGNDSVYGGGGNDKIDGGAGNDVLNGGAGADSLDGGLGKTGGLHDVADYSTSTGPVQVSLVAGAIGKLNDAAGDKLVNIEDLTGSAFGDKLTGNTKANVILGGDGVDRILGGGGNDSINGGNQKDSLYGGLGNDSIIGDLVADHFVGSDLISGGAGNDLLTGGAGFDRFVFHAGDGNDTITDFKANSTDAKHLNQDHILTTQDIIDGFANNLDQKTLVADGVLLDFFDADHMHLGSILFEGVHSLAAIGISDFALG